MINDRVVSFSDSQGSSKSVALESVFKDTTPRFLLFDTSEGALWAMGAAGSGNIVMQRAELDPDKSQFLAQDSMKLPVGLMWPVFSPWKSWLVDIDQHQQVSELRVRDRTGKTLNSWTLPKTDWQDPTSFVVLRNQPLRSISFVRNSNWVAARTGPSSIAIYDVNKDGEAPLATLKLPEEAQGDPLRPSWFSRRPPTASVLDKGVLTLAWATRRVIEVVRWSQSSGKTTSEEPLVYSPDSGSTIADLRFFPGNYLLVTVTEPGTFAVGFRLFDLNLATQNEIESMNDAKLLRTACDRLSPDRGGATEIARICSTLGG